MCPKRIFEPFVPLLLVLSASFIKTVLTKSILLEESGGRKIRCLETERLSLLNFKQGLIDANGMLSSWSDEENERDCCRWAGIVCDNVTGRVQRLDLHGSYDSPNYGKDISPSLVALMDLDYLDLSFIGFYSVPFPDFIGSFSKLRYLNLSNTFFRGSIPPHLGNLTELRYLDLAHIGGENNLDWISPRFRSLEYLDLSSVDLSKATDWFRKISMLPAMKVLRLSQCSLPQIFSPSDSFVTSYLNSSAASLSIIDLSFNYRMLSRNGDLLLYWILNFTGSLTSLDLSYTGLEAGSYDNILDGFGNMVTLSHIDLSSNSLEHIPKCFGNMSSLRSLIMYDNSLIRQLPDLMMNLSSGPLKNTLRILDLGWNRINGVLPNMSRFSFLNTLILSSNQLNGTISGGFLRLPNLVKLDLSSNNFTGQVPDLSFSKCSLRELYLGENMFNGTLMGSIGSLSKLEVLSLHSNRLEIAITGAHVVNLSRLQQLDLSYNSWLNVEWNNNSPFFPPFQLNYMNLSGCKLGPRFPKLMQTQERLAILDISDAQISDTISNLFSYLPHTLQYLNASNNQIYGSLPKVAFFNFNSSRVFRNVTFLTYQPLSQGLKVLDLSRNTITGSAQFFCSFTRLSIMDLSYNLLDHLPDCFASFEDLQILNLDSNHFHGKIPPSIGILSSLHSLHLQNNNFSGEIPASIGSRGNLVALELGRNSLTGEVPSWIGNLSILVVLVLRNNAFSGPIPSNLCSLKSLRVLDLSCNKISGGIPKCLHKLTAMTQDHSNIPVEDVSIVDIEKTAFIYVIEIADMIWKREMATTKSSNMATLIDLSSNNLGGEIPRQITKLTGILGLNLSINSLTGPIPWDIGNLTLLNALDLSRNHLSGAIPISLSELSHLGILDLSYNSLSGRIPQNGHLLTFDESTYVGNSGLCGRPLNRSCPGDRINARNDDHDDDDDDEDEFISEGFYISMGLGFVVGFWAIFGTILLNKSFRCWFLKTANDIEDFVNVRVELKKIRFRRNFHKGQALTTNSSLRICIMLILFLFLYQYIFL